MDTKTLNVGQQSLLGYLPATVIQNILDNRIKFDNNVEWKKNLPQHYMMHTVSLFADISGFTKLGEAFAKKGRIGPEFLAFSLNRYMEQLINIISKNGGDIFKFAGDALLVIWPESKKKKNLSESCQRAIQCALEIQSKLHNQEIASGKRLSIKVGIGVGECTILYVGGQFRRCESLSVGEALAHACESETKALGGGETICHENVKKMCEGIFEYEECTGLDSYGKPIDNTEGRFYRIKAMLGEKIATKADTYLMRSQFSSEKLLKNLSLLKSFVPAAIVNYLDIEKENYSKEIRVLSIMFLNLNIKLEDTRTDDGVHRIQNIVNCVQRCIYRTRGALNKFLMDDKGSVMLCCWGLPPMSSSEDHTRAVLTGLSLMKSLIKYECGALMGITTGSCFVGVCGAMGGQREYSLLGGVVNCSARFMQQAISYAIDNKLKYQCLIDETTKDLIQNKIICEYICDGMLKGFANKWYFYEPKVSYNDDKSYQTNNPFPDIRTLKYNVPYGKTNANLKEDKNTFFIKKSLFTVGRKIEIENAMSDLGQIYALGKNELIVVKGITGSGKSHFTRRLLWQFLESNRELRTKNQSKTPIIFATYQIPISFSSPLNAWRKTVKRIYDILKENFTRKISVKKKMEGETFSVDCDIIGEILLDSDTYGYINYINEILEANLKDHIESNPKFEKYFSVTELPQIDNFFEPRKFAGMEKYVCSFFLRLIETYHMFINESQKQQNLLYYPLFFVIEDSQIIDEISVELIRQINESNIKGIGIICTYQEPINNLLKNPNDKFYKLSNLINPDKEYFMSGLVEDHEISELIKFNISDTLSVTTIDSELIKIIKKKSFRGTPIFIIELIESLLAQKFIQFPYQQLITTSDLNDMDKTGNWSTFVIPIRFEKILGNIIDCLTVKEIIILKYASVIGNIFDLSTLNRINPFNNLSLIDTYGLLSKFESLGLIEFLHDFNPKTLVCKFSLPFLNNVLYQRMLIEQKNEIHMNIARCLQHTKFSFMPQEEELCILNNHLKISEKSIINYMDEDDDDILRKDKRLDKKSFNINNLKIFYVKELCEKLKSIDLRLNFDEDDYFKNAIQIIKSGDILKKSDKGFTWEQRYVAFSKSRCYYWYQRWEYEDNKMPLGAFDLKNLYSADIIPDYTIGGRANVFCVQVSSWLKKEVLRGPRVYYFSVASKADLYCWVIYLNFLRVKAIYDSFISQFGQIHLPLKHEKTRKRVKLKNKYNQGNILKNINTFSVSSYLKHTYDRKNTPGLFHSKRVKKEEKEEIIQNRSVSLKRTSVLFQTLIENPNEEQEIQNHIIKLKTILNNVFGYSYMSFVGCIMNIIFGLTSVGLRNDEKVIIIPNDISLSIPNDTNSYYETPVKPLEAQYNSVEKTEKASIVIGASNKKAFDNGLLKSQVKITEELNEENNSDNEKEKAKNKKNKVVILENTSDNHAPSKNDLIVPDSKNDLKQHKENKKSIINIISDNIGLLTENIGENLLGGFNILTGRSNATKEPPKTNLTTTDLKNNNNTTSKLKNESNLKNNDNNKAEKKNTKNEVFSAKSDLDIQPVKTNNTAKENMNFSNSQNLGVGLMKKDTKMGNNTGYSNNNLSENNLNTSSMRLNNKNEFEKIPQISNKLLNLGTSEDEDDDYLKNLKNGLNNNLNIPENQLKEKHAELKIISNIFNKK